MLRLPRVYCPISDKLDLDIGKILFTLSFIKHEQFDFSFLVNGKSAEKIVFPSILWVISVFFNLNPKWKGFFHNFSYNYVFLGMGKGSNKLLYKETLAQGHNPTYFTWCFWQERLPFHMDVASSFKPLSKS